jgi:hypothetical protein
VNQILDSLFSALAKSELGIVFLWQILVLALIWYTPGLRVTLGNIRDIIESVKGLTVAQRELTEVMLRRMEAPNDQLLKEMNSIKRLIKQSTQEIKATCLDDDEE